MKLSEKIISKLHLIKSKIVRRIKRAIRLIKLSLKEYKVISEIRKIVGISWKNACNQLCKAVDNGIPAHQYIPCEYWKLNPEQIIVLKKKCKYINSICGATKWTWEQAKINIENAEIHGISNYQYVKNECWNMSEDEFVAFGRTLEAKTSLKKRGIEKRHYKLSDLTSEQQKTVKKAVELGIPEEECLRKMIWQLSDEEVVEFAEAVDKRRRLAKLDHNFFVSMICKKTGWDKNTAEQKLAEGVEKGISELKYVQKIAWTKNEKQLEVLIRELENNKKRINSNKLNYLSRICEVTGWTVAKAELEILKSKVVSRASYEDYLAFRFWEVPIEKQKEYATLNLFNKMNIMYIDSVVGRKSLDDKANFNKLFKEYIHRVWFTNFDLSYEDFLKYIEHIDFMLIKPLTATQGIGIEKIDCRVYENDKRKLYEKIISMPRSIVEEFIVQHDEVKKFCDTSVNTVRVMTINYNGNCKILYGLFRSGRGSSVDNFHAGGVAAAIDVETGVVCTNGADVNFDFYEVHPYSGLEIKGFQIPHWDKVKETCMKISKIVPEVGLIGWDFAITPEGIDLIEGNSGAYIVAQLLYSSENIGLRKLLIDPYIDLSTISLNA